MGPQNLVKESNQVIKIKPTKIINQDLKKLKENVGLKNKPSQLMQLIRLELIMDQDVRLTTNVPNIIKPQLKSRKIPQTFQLKPTLNL